MESETSSSRSFIIKSAGSKSKVPSWFQPYKTPAMNLARFKTMRRTNKLAFSELNDKMVQVWYDFDSMPLPTPFFQPFNYPITTIRFIPADERKLADYRNLLHDMNEVYSAIYDELDYKMHILQPHEITSGRYAVGKSCALRTDVRRVAYGDYQRVLIQETFSERSHLIKCLAVDQGNTIMVDFRELFYLTDDYARLPAKSIAVPLTGLEPFQMSTELRNILLYELFLHSSIITLTERDDNGNSQECLKMTSSVFPNEDLIEVIRKKIRRAYHDPARTPYDRLVEKAMVTDKDCVSFTSFVPVRTGANFGTLKGTPVNLHLGAKLDIIVIGVGGHSELRIIPYATFKAQLLKGFPIDELMDQGWIKKAKNCPCIKDGSHFIVKHNGCIERCQLLNRSYYKGHLRSEFQNPVKRVKVLLIDKADVATVRAEDVNSIPPTYAEFLPAQAVVAFWVAQDNRPFNWPDKEWKAFGEFAMHNRFTAIVKRYRQDDNGLYFARVELYNPQTDEKLDPTKLFWLTGDG